MTLRIAHIDTEKSWRGGENQVFLLMKGLKARGHENFCVARSGSALAARAEEAGFNIKSVRPWGEWDFIAAHFLNRWLKEEKIDVVHAHSSHGVALAAFSTLGTDIPVVATRRVDFPLSKNPFSRWKYERLRKIIAISNGVKRVLMESGIPEVKINLIPSGIDFTLFTKVKKAWASEMGIPEEAKIIGQVAALAPHKDQVTLIEGFSFVKKNHPDLHLVLVGDGDLRSALEHQADRLGLKSSIHFLGFKNDPLRFLAAFDVFCLSSQEEGLGTSLLDAMALRVPIVATNVGGIPDLIQDGLTGFLAPAKNPAALAEKIEQALQVRAVDPGLLDRAYQHARHFDYQSTVHSVEKLYRSMI